MASSSDEEFLLLETSMTLKPQHMPEPTENSFKEIAKDFLDIWNFPHCLGALDGKRVRVKCPRNSGSMYFSYKKYHSIVLQAVTDARYRFIAIDVGGYGKRSDGGTFHPSDLYNAIEGNILKVPKPTTLPASNVLAPFVFIADEAYPLLPYLMKSYSGGDLPLEQECYNKRLSHARKSVECAFGILTSKWRILNKSVDANESLVDDIIKCVCIPHNTVIDIDGVQMNPTEVTCKQ
ncbi:protein ANTAGONIST OF LIKE HETEROCHROMATIN PROTEIN 1 [Elysia marginata]|uniref:Protein ANTAGONIST OF LIKE HETEROCHROMATIN PROTEIN 1 n=1 Tax=Elysia marginata TaxID=1093978 RepID=A0AAV4ESC8_9GAST|nr:protein ANTAGONIST OF LIKE HETEROCHROMATIN PROTEIN 1 [Elysia marginata]